MKMLKVKQVAELIRVNPNTVYIWAERGKIPSFKLNSRLRFSESEILDWIENRHSYSWDYLSSKL